MSLLYWGTGAGEFYLGENTFKNSDFKAVFVRFGATLGATGASIATHSRGAVFVLVGGGYALFVGSSNSSRLTLSKHAYSA